MTERNKKLSLAGRLRMVAACPDANASLCAEAADAIERHEAFKQEVSDKINAYVHATSADDWENLKTLIIPAKPDPLMELVKDLYLPDEYADRIRSALDALGLEVRDRTMTADKIVTAWLKENIKLIEDCYEGSRKDDPVEKNQDYQALKRVLNYITDTYQ